MFGVTWYFSSFVIVALSGTEISNTKLILPTTQIKFIVLIINLKKTTYLNKTSIAYSSKILIINRLNLILKYDLLILSMPMDFDNFYFSLSKPFLPRI